MDIAYFGTTVINGLDECAVRVLTEHETRIEEGDDFGGTNPTRFGSIVHEVVEIAHQYDARGEACPDPADLFDDVWRRHYLTDFNYYDLGRESIEDFVNRTLYDRPGVTIATEWAFILDMVELQVVPIPQDISFAKRKQFVAKWTKKIRDRGGVPVVSMVDRVDRISDTEFEVYDYKTSVIPFTRDEVEWSKQLFIYDVAVRAHWPEAESVKCVYDLLRHGRQPTTFDDVQRETLRAYIINLWEQVKSWDYPIPTLNPYCNWCSIKGRCPVYAEAIAGDLVNSWAPDGLDAEELYEEYEQLKIVAKIVDQRLKDFGAGIMAHIKGNDNRPITIGEDDEIYLMPNPRYEYPADSVFEVLKRHKALTLLKRAATISKPNLDRQLKGRVKLKAAIEPLLEKKFVSPTLKKRRRKNEKPTTKKKGKKNAKASTRKRTS